MEQSIQNETIRPIDTCDDRGHGSAIANVDSPQTHGIWNCPDTVLWLLLVLEMRMHRNAVEDSPSGLWRTLGKRVGVTASRVRISYPPPFKGLGPAAKTFFTSGPPYPIRQADNPRMLAQSGPVPHNRDGQAVTVPLPAPAARACPRCRARPLPAAIPGPSEPPRRPCPT